MADTSRAGLAARRRGTSASWDLLEAAGESCWLMKPPDHHSSRETSEVAKQVF